MGIMQTSTQGLCVMRSLIIMLLVLPNAIAEVERVITHGLSVQSLFKSRFRCMILDVA
jgi:hypothetical protein